MWNLDLDMGHWQGRDDGHESADDEGLVSLSTSQTLKISSLCSPVSSIWDAASLSARCAGLRCTHSSISASALSCNKQLLLAPTSRDTSRVRTATLQSRFKGFRFFFFYSSFFFLYLCRTGCCSLLKIVFSFENKGWKVDIVLFVFGGTHLNNVHESKVENVFV